VDALSIYPSLAAFRGCDCWANASGEFRLTAHTATPMTIAPDAAEI
jgi:hypothetical protein